MLVSNWAQNYWAVSTDPKKTLYDYKKVLGLAVEPLEDCSVMDTSIRGGNFNFKFYKSHLEVESRLSKCNEKSGD